MTRDLGMVPRTTPVVADGVIYTGGADGSLAAIDAGTGKLLWRTSMTGRIAGAPAVLGGTIYIGTLHGVFYALSSPVLSASTPAGTAASTPVFSGQPCPPPVDRGSSDQAVPGTPAASLVPQSPFSGQRLNQADLPTGQAVSAATVEELRRTIEQLTTCDVSGGSERARAFYSNDYLRRFQGRPSPDAFWPGPRNFTFTLTGARLLPDGRTGVIVTAAGQIPLFVIFVQQQDRWLIDEIAPVSLPSGTPSAGGLG